MGDKEIPARGPVGRMGDPWDEERMKLALQRIMQQIEITPIKRIGGRPPLEPFLGNTALWANWFVELLIEEGIRATWWDANLKSHMDGTFKLWWVNPGLTVFEAPGTFTFLGKVDLLIQAAVNAGRIPATPDIGWES